MFNEYDDAYETEPIEYCPRCGEPYLVPGACPDCLSELLEEAQDSIYVPAIGGAPSADVQRRSAVPGYSGVGHSGNSGAKGS